MTEVSWCMNCNIPILDSVDCSVCGSKTRGLKTRSGDLRPVFAPEKRLIEEILRERNIGDFEIPSKLCFRSRGEFIADGKKIFRVGYHSSTNSWKIEFLKEAFDQDSNLEGSDIRKTLEANASFLGQREELSLCVLREVFAQNESIPKFVSFSGGKDSTVALFLARTVLPSIEAVFMNTTVELPGTVDFVHEIASTWNLHLEEVLPTRDFFEMCKLMGPPSRFMKWCCKTQKFAPLSRFIETHYPEEVLVVSGLRRAESHNRKSMKVVQLNQAISRQKLVFPILDWATIDVWLYILWKRIPFNKEYLCGFDRIGCWVCPEKAARDFKLVETFHPELSSKFTSFLREYAKEDKRDLDWVRQRKWALRSSSYDKVMAISSLYCPTKREIMYSIESGDTVRKAKEFLKIFGEPVFDDEIWIVEGDQVQITLDRNFLRAKFSTEGSKRLFERQLLKAANCIGCGACVGLCPHGAISAEEGKVKISNACQHCLKCLETSGLRRSCVALNYKKRLEVIEQQIIGSRQHRGSLPQESLIVA